MLVPRTSRCICSLQQHYYEYLYIHYALEPCTRTTKLFPGEGARTCAAFEWGKVEDASGDGGGVGDENITEWNFEKVGLKLVHSSTTITAQEFNNENITTPDEHVTI